MKRDTFLKDTPQDITDMMLQKHQGTVERDFENLMHDSRIVYTGIGSAIRISLSRKRRPDFTITGQRKVIEIFESHHKAREVQETVNDYAIIDYDCLVVWESDIYSRPRDVKRKVKEFVKT